MKNFKLFLFAAAGRAATSFLALAALTVIFTSCDKEPPVNPPVTIDFEDAALDGKGVLLDSYTGKYGLTFVNNYVSEYGYWYGFAISDNTDTQTPGSGNEFSTYAGGGYGGSKKFAVVYYASWDGATECTFPSEGYSPVGLYITNSTYTVLDTEQGSAFSDPFTDGDRFVATMTGYDAAGEKTGSVDVDLIDFRDGKTYVCDKWLHVDLTPLGRVARIEFSCESTDTGTPTYFCIDNLTYKLPPLE